MSRVLLSSIGVCKHLKQRRCYVRCPILGVLGHVDHGKTTLIDGLRNTNNVYFEAGGITQINSLFQHTIEEQNYTFTIVDTPGHAAFSKMRATGTALVDTAILVVDAVDGVKPQTRECIHLLKTSEIPIVVAINKIDLPRANSMACHEMLFEEGIETVEVGGSVPAVSISALRGTNIRGLMRTVKSVTDSLDLTVRSSGTMEGILFDIKSNKNSIIATILVEKGSVQKGDFFITDTHVSHVRELLSLDGQKVSCALPGEPCRINGPQNFNPNFTLGSKIYSVPRPRRHRQRMATNALITKLQNRMIKNVFQETYEALPFGKKKLSFMLCADSNSTIEILKQMLDVDMDDVRVSVFSSSVKSLTEDQVKLAESIGAHIILFNVSPLGYSTTAPVYHFDIIYELAHSINSAINKFLPPNMKRQYVGEGVIYGVHGTTKKPVVGVSDLTGQLSRANEFSITRYGTEIWTGHIDSLRYFKAMVTETSVDMKECGVGFPKRSIPGKLQVGDILKCFYSLHVDRPFLDGKFYSGGGSDGPSSQSNEIYNNSDYA